MVSVQVIAKEAALALSRSTDAASCSFILPTFAMGSARGKLDGSSCCVTCFHMNPIVLRWITRSAYNIPGSDLEDCMYGLFCPCCTINQVAQTASQLGKPYPDVGPEHNRYPPSIQQNADCCENCCYTTFCLPCAIGTTLQSSMGMPFWMGCLCSNFCIARNLVRYHYRLSGSDIGEDCLLPYGTCCLACVLSAWVPCAMCCTCPLFIGMIMNTLNEAKTRGNANPGAPNGSYLNAPARPAQFNNPVGAPAAYVQQPAQAPVAYVQQPVYAQQQAAAPVAYVQQQQPPAAYLQQPAVAAPVYAQAYDPAGSVSKA